MNLNPSTTVQSKNSPLPLYILPTPAANSKPAALAPKSHASPSLLVQNIRKLVATIRAFATTSKTMEAAHIAWHSGWFGCWSTRTLAYPQAPPVSTTSKSLKNWFGGSTASPTFALIFVVLSCFLLFYFNFFNVFF